MALGKDMVSGYNADRADASNEEVEWETGNELVTEVSVEGFVRGINAGTAIGDMLRVFGQQQKEYALTLDEIDME